VGLTFRQYVHERRLAAATRLLVDSKLSVKKVWRAVGYKHASDFDHHFRRMYGMPPTKYRTAPLLLLGRPGVADAACSRD
jgi:transcriptional regulator GlxA family with amidase domain